MKADGTNHQKTKKYQSKVLTHPKKTVHEKS